MKTIKTLLVGLMMMVSTAMIAQPMNYNAIRNNARFLTDRMAYTLGITNPVLIDDIYRINFDYIYGVNEYLDDVALGYRYDDYMMICEERDYALRMLLGDVIWSRIIGYDYFHRPIMFENHRWRFGIYLHDWDRAHFYCAAPRYYDGGYRGGHFFGGMRPHRGIADRGPGMANWGPRQATPNRGGHTNGGYRGEPNRGGNYNGGHGAGVGAGGGVHPNGAGRGEGGNRGDMNHGGSNTNATGAPNRGNFPGGNTRGEANRGTTAPTGNAGRDNMNRDNMNRGNSRSEGNSRSSSRSGSFGGGSTRGGGNVGGGSSSGSSRGGVSRGGGSSSRGSVTNGRR